MIERVIMLAALLVLFVPIFRARPDRRPGNLAPIQIISAIGAWTLIVANASAIAIAIRDESVALFCTAITTVIVALVSFVRDDVARIPEGATPESLNRVLADLKRLLGGAPRLGVRSLDAVVVAGHCPGIGVTVAPQGRVVVRIRHDVAQWLERHQRAGKARYEVVSSFVRFTVQHELGHVLNGDHRTFRFVRSVLIAHLVWIAGAAAMAASLIMSPTASSTPLIVAAAIGGLFVVQSLIARRFIAERERLADWRAMQTLAPDDAARLLERRGRRRATPNPTELEKLMNDLKAQAPPRTGRNLLLQLTALVWPEGDGIHQRSERAGDRKGEPPRLRLWAALIGMQSGLLSMTLQLAAFVAADRWIGAQRQISEAVMLASWIWVGMPAAMFCEVSVDPARMTLRKPSRARERFVVGAVFYLAFGASALALYRCYARLGIASMPSFPFFAVMVVLFALLVGVCIWVAQGIGDSYGGGELRITPRASWVQVFPVLAGMAALIPLSIAASYWLGLGSLRSGEWIPLAFMSFAGFVVTTGMARSTSPALRAIAPIALFDTPPPVYGFRVLWREFYVDLSRVTLARGMATAMAVQMIAMPFFVLATGLLMRGMGAIFTERTVFLVTFIGAFVVMALILVIPDRYQAYKGPSASLLDTGWLRILEKLLAASRAARPEAADRLTGSLAQWIRNERFPNAVLPDKRAVWPLAPLSSLVRLARATGETEVLDRWRTRIEQSLREIISDDAVALAPDQPPSIHWTALAATIIDEAGLQGMFRFEAMLDRIEILLDERLALGTSNLLSDVITAYQLLRRHGRTGPDPRRLRRFARSSSLVSRPLLRQSLAELCELADLTDDSELRERLRPIVRSRLWEVLQLNPRKDVLLLLDCYLAAASLGEVDSRHAAAEETIEELTERASAELVAVAGGER